MGVAYNALGTMAWAGQDEPEGKPNMTSARDYFERGVMYNCSDCAHNLGILHTYGWGVDAANATRGKWLLLSFFAYRCDHAAFACSARQLRISNFCSSRTCYHPF